MLGILAAAAAAAPIGRSWAQGQQVIRLIVPFTVGTGPDLLARILTEELKERWQVYTNGNCVFISATEKTNLHELRQVVLNQVRKLYQKKYPYKAEFFY